MDAGVARTNKFHVTTTEKTMISGGIAGSIGKTITAPLSRLTILYQVGPVLTSGNAVGQFNAKDSLMTTSRNILKNEGVLAFWKGNFTSVIHRFPYSAVNFYSYEVSRSFLMSKFNSKETPTIRFFCGGFSGLAASFMCYPLELIRTRMTVKDTFSTVKDVLKDSTEASLNPKRYQSKIYGAFRDILAQDGVLGLYRGLSVSLCVSVPTLAIGFSVYGYMKQKLLQMGGIFARDNHTHSGTHLSAIGALLSGSVSGVTSSLIMFPADVIRKRMQVMNGKMSPLVTTNAKSSVQVTSSNTLTTMPDPHVNGNLKIQYSNTTTINASVGAGSGTGPRSIIFNHYRSILKSDGIRGMYRGIVPELLKVCPMVAITFCTYEMTSEFLNDYFPTPSVLQVD